MTLRPAALGGLLVAVLFGTLVVQRPAPVPAGSWARMPREQRAAGRDAYFLDLVRDPATGRVPDDIRERELAYAATLPVNDGLSKNGVPLFDWTEAGPNDVGGRTRALAVDAANSNVILTGGVSGGIWKSVDAGLSWRLVTSPGAVVGVTTLAQDVRPGRTSVWYAATGEYLGASQVDRGGVAAIYGSGVFTSVDNGDTWTRVVSAGNPTRFDNVFDFVLRVAVSPATGTLFTCNAAVGIYRSTDRGATFSNNGAPVLGRVNDHILCDVAVGSDGTVVAYLGAPFAGVTPLNAPGLYRSADDGLTWAPVAAGVLPTTAYRPVIALAPSNPNVGYVYLSLFNANGSLNAAARVYRVDLAANTAAERTVNLPAFGTQTGYLNLQGAYNMTLAVKPDDENFVVIGATDLFRTRDGFATPINNRSDWIGGYTSSTNSQGGPFAGYANHHPDQHALFFDARNPNRLWSGHDGGVTVLADVRAATSTADWGDRNLGYNVTQLYHVSMPAAAGDMQSIAGAQDNGSLYLARPGAASSEAGAGGDGSYSFMGNPYRYASSQNGSVIRLGPTDFAFVTPAGADEKLFIHPFAIDTANENVMYYPDGDTLWRNNALAAVPPFNQAPTAVGWTKLPVSAALGYRITAVEIANGAAPRLYYGAYSRAGVPRLYRLDAPQTALDGEVELTLPADAPVGAYIHDLAANPANADELLVVMSNYNVRGLYHTLDGGATWTVVEGNLEGTGALPGPSLRSASILNHKGKKVYLVGTSTGLYATMALGGDATVWEQQDPSGIGASIVEHVASRPSDGRVLAATHGRGLFNGMPGAALPNEAASTAAATTLLPAFPNPARGTATFAFSLSAPARVTLKLYDALGREVATVVPAGPFAAGRHAQPFDVGRLAPGSYVYRLETDGARRTQRAAVLTVVR